MEKELTDALLHERMKNILNKEEQFSGSITIRDLAHRFRVAFDSERYFFAEVTTFESEDNFATTRTNLTKYDLLDFLSAYFRLESRVRAMGERKIDAAQYMVSIQSTRINDGKEVRRENDSIAYFDAKRLEEQLCKKYPELIETLHSVDPSDTAKQEVDDAAALEAFKEKHPEFFGKSGRLKSSAIDLIERLLEQDAIDNSKKQTGKVPVKK